MMRRLAIGGLSFVAACPVPALAESAFTFSGEAALVSDYRFRGVSLSNEKPAVQAGLSVEHESGAYAGIWASTIAESEGGARIETDYLVGYATELGKVAVDANLTWYRYPSDSSLDYIEGNVAMAVPVGPFSTTLGASYAPAQSATVDSTGVETDNFYVFAQAERALGTLPVSVRSRLGYEKGAFDLSEDGGKWDWEIGARYQMGAFYADLAYVDAGARRSVFPLEAALIAAVGVGF